LRDRLRVLHPDLVFAQEVQEQHSMRHKRFAQWPEGDMSRFLAADFWSDSHYGRNAVYEHGHHGNAILSRHPLTCGPNHDISAYRFERRGLLHAEITLPQLAVPLHCFCVHLALLERGRMTQVGEILEHVAALAPDAPVILAGDFNDWRKRVSSRFTAAGFTEVFESFTGKPAMTFPAHLPVLPLDRVYVRGLKVRDARVLRDWAGLSDHLGLWAELDTGEYAA
jgi:endonuclease/exonuclease/phosphatase family metal-dependent hydrolase